MTRRVLFICGKARHRSPTAADILAKQTATETDAAGLSDDADVPLSPEQIAWATHVVVMEKRQITRLRRKHAKAISGKQIICLDIADRYRYMQPELIDLIRDRMRRIR